MKVCRVDAHVAKSRATEEHQNNQQDDHPLNLGTSLIHLKRKMVMMLAGHLKNSLTNLSTLVNLYSTNPAWIRMHRKTEKAEKIPV